MFFEAFAPFLDALVSIGDDLTFLCNEIMHTLQKLETALEWSLRRQYMNMYCLVLSCGQIKIRLGKGGKKLDNYGLLPSAHRSIFCKFLMPWIILS